MITLKGLSAYLLTTALAASLVFALPLASNDDHRPADSSSNINSKIPFRIRGRPKEIVNGTETEPFAFPWIAQISHLDDHYCGGVFIAPDVILTAAHCSKFEPSEYNVSWHRHDLRKSTNQEKGQDFIVEKIIKHSNYLQPSFGSDIALWKLAPVGDTQHLPDIGYIELDDGSVASDVGLMLTSAGWGSTSFLGETSSVLMQVSVPIVDQEVCRQNYRGKINHEMVCAGYEQGGKGKS